MDGLLLTELIVLNGEDGGPESVTAFVAVAPPPDGPTDVPAVDVDGGPSLPDDPASADAGALRDGVAVAASSLCSRSRELE